MVLIVPRTRVYDSRVTFSITIMSMSARCSFTAWRHESSVLLRIIAVNTSRGTYMPVHASSTETVIAAMTAMRKETVHRPLKPFSESRARETPPVVAPEAARDFRDFSDFGEALLSAPHVTWEAAPIERTERDTQSDLCTLSLPPGDMPDILRPALASSSSKQRRPPGLPIRLPAMPLAKDAGSSIAMTMRARTSSMMLELEVALLLIGRREAPDLQEPMAFAEPESGLAPGVPLQLIRPSIRCG
mmetsp:Transcript_52849/g.139522  ORF Transcript_52849/g.139522 Transcript_52849/m.139522 type:complete len:245 (+) Transcript_52849:1535-2269(+)